MFFFFLFSLLPSSYFILFFSFFLLHARQAIWTHRFCEGQGFSLLDGMFICEPVDVLLHRILEYNSRGHWAQEFWSVEPLFFACAAIVSSLSAQSTDIDPAEQVAVGETFNWSPNLLLLLLRGFAEDVHASAESFERFRSLLGLLLPELVHWTVPSVVFVRVGTLAARADHRSVLCRFVEKCLIVV